MKSKQNYTSAYRRNRILVSVFVLLLTATLVVALILADRFTKKFVEGQFDSEKAKVLDKTIAPYNDFINNKTNQISLYQGFLDSTSVNKLSDRLFAEYPFINDMVFYDLEVGNKSGPLGVHKEQLSADFKSIHEFERNKPRRLLYSEKSRFSRYSPDIEADFRAALLKFTAYIETVDTNATLDNNQLLKAFYGVTDKKVSVLNIPRRQEIGAYKKLFNTYGHDSSARYQQDLLVFSLNPSKLRIDNIAPQLYEQILIRSYMFDSLSTERRNFYTTGIALPGAFSDYQLYFVASKEHINKERSRVFKPLAIGFVFVYLLVLSIAYLIFRNLYINSKLFKLQYDFINNLTHEFKTPVSVIKIAGDNIRSAQTLSDRERMTYGRILNEEADKLNELMSKLLSFTQLENKSIKLKYTNVNLLQLCRNSVDAYKIKYPDLVVEYTIESVETIQTDSILLNSVFTNMIDNAYKYSQPDKKHLRILIKRQRKNVVFRFIDKGIGIEKKELENIFKKFYKVDNEFNRHGSVGIGLAFCKEVINFMHGEIKVESQPGVGSEFTITLPYKRPHQEAETSDTNSNNSGRINT